jgi:hypothetical protein
MSTFVKVTGWALFLLGLVFLAFVLFSTSISPDQTRVIWLLGPLTYATTWPLLISGALLILFGRIVELLSDIHSELHALRKEAEFARLPGQLAQ